MSERDNQMQILGTKQTTRLTHTKTPMIDRSDIAMDHEDTPEFGILPNLTISER